jgi:8-hydroxy-5-deazaflavin:NADPH oxidoreductase
MSSLSIIGSGNMARGIATRALPGGNRVQILARQKDKAAALAADLAGEVTAGTIGEPLAGDIVVLAVPYDAAAPLIREYADRLDDKIIVDITNPIDWASFDRLVVPGTSSGAQEIANTAPSGAKVVKAFNTTFAGTLLAGQVAGEPLDVLIAGDDPAAKKAVADVVVGGGMRPIDAGPLRRAQQLEHAGFLHMALQEPLGTGYASALRFLG